MPAPIFLGDEVSAAGFRLAGARARVPAPGEEASFLEQARREAELVLLSAECAARIPAPLLRRALTAPLPLVLVVPDLLGRAEPPDLAARLLAQLGIAE
ncbi:V-type ATP synthase subunit F [Ramlibacter sp. 2FC]|uniref:V-type ATP synthase subunit F n=1 Tax=Ramlibacter sp. 2FC TaxID=2502188 RepID=UPI0010F7E6F5|nr:V-type ATP synthase subunit F [Ramlibacter sp. 2FC]